MPSDSSRAGAIASNVISYENPVHNMYGCAPCPKCGSKYRAAFRKSGGPDSGGLRIECDDCGHNEWAAQSEGEVQK